jgi:hypothetical protein
MNLNRRSVIKNLLIIAGGVTFIPSCMQKEEAKASIQLKHIDVNSHDEKLIAELAETIIPKTDTPGSKDVYTHLYILKMIDDCSTKTEQKRFVKGIKAFEQFSRNQLKLPFVQLNPAQREQLVQQVQNEKGVPEDVLEFYNTVKEMTVRGFLTSKYYLSEVQVYELVPGRFKGCVPATQSIKERKEKKQHV